MEPCTAPPGYDVFGKFVPGVTLLVGLSMLLPEQARVRIGVPLLLLLVLGFVVGRLLHSSVNYAGRTSPQRLLLRIATFLLVATTVTTTALASLTGTLLLVGRETTRVLASERTARFLDNVRRILVIVLLFLLVRDVLQTSGAVTIPPWLLSP